MRLLQLAAVLLAVIAAAPATAATVTRSERDFDCGRGCTITYDEIDVVDTAGERNDVRVVTDETGATITDAGAPLVAGAGCAAEGAGVRCAFTADEHTVSVEAGPGDDRVAGSGDALGTFAGGDGTDHLSAEAADDAYLSGGAGADVLEIGDGVDAARFFGGPGPDEMTGGPGEDLFLEGTDDGSPDEIDGGGGERDLLSYRDRERGVTVDLAAGIGGEPGEGDRLSAIDVVQGGRGADRLLGSADGDRLESGRRAAGDVIHGRGGNDSIQGWNGADRLLGGRGDDWIEGYGNRDRIHAGAGDDRVGARPSDQPGAALVACGAGRDLVREPKRATVALDCEHLDLLATLRPALRDGRLVVRAQWRGCALRIGAGGRIRRVDLDAGRGRFALDRGQRTFHLQVSQGCGPRGGTPRGWYPAGTVTLVPEP